MSWCLTTRLGLGSTPTLQIPRWAQKFRCEKNSVSGLGLKGASARIANVVRNRALRRGAFAVMVVLLLVVIIGMVAYAFDTGWIALTRVQLHAAADSAALAGGTELMPGLGLNATATPGEVQTLAVAAAVEFAGRNPGGDRDSCYCDGTRDVIMGTAVFDPDAGQWVKTPGATPFNFVQANLHRDQGGSSAGDGRLPLFFARIFGIRETPVSGFATAVILPANGFFIEEGSDDTVGLMPFAFNREMFERYKRARDYYEANPDVFGDPENLENIMDPTTDPPEPLFGFMGPQGGGGGGPATEFKQLFYDDFTLVDGNVSGPDAPDGILEIDIYPHAGAITEENPGGNFGTVDLGNTNNSTADIKRQIENGLNEDDLSYYENNTITMSEEDPLLAEADTGISGGIEKKLEQIIGDCRAIVLFTAVTDESGNNTIYTLVEYLGVAVVQVELGSANKILRMQPCDFVDDNAIGDTDEEIGEDTTVFTPLILIE
ncbi:MAG: pilus assembly protein TadG-related protein [Aeoliella sp.]